MNEDQLRSRLKQVVSGEEEGIEWAEKVYQEKLEKANQKASGDMSEEMKQEWAISAVDSAVVRGSRSGGRSGSGDVVETEILAVGHSGYQEWGDGADARDALVAYGIVQPQSPDKDHPKKFGVVYCDGKTGADLGNIKSKFQTLNTLKGWFQVEQSDELPNAYVLNAVDETRVEDLQTEASNEALRQEIHNHIDESDAANIKNISSYLSMRESNGYLAEFGGDLKRLECEVIEYYVGDGFNKLTVKDDSVDPSKLGSDIVDDRARSPGLTCWVPDDFMNYGRDSWLELYGTIKQKNDGQISMSVVGVYPILGTEMEDDYEDYEDDNEPSDRGTTTVEEI